MKNDQFSPISSRRVYQLWTTFTPAEQKDFLNGRLKEPRLKAIVKQFGKIDDPIELWRKVFGRRKTFNSGTLRVYLSKIKTALEEYLILLEAGPQGVKGKLHLASHFENRGQLSLSLIYSQQARKELDASSNRDLSYTEQLLEAERLVFRSSSLDAIKTTGKVHHLRQLSLRKLLLTLAQDGFLIRSQKMVATKDESTSWEFAMIDAMSNLAEVQPLLAHDTVIAAYMFLLKEINQPHFDVDLAQQLIESAWEKLDEETRYIFVGSIYNRLSGNVRHDVLPESAIRLRMFIYKWHLRGVLEAGNQSWPVLFIWLIRLSCITNKVREARTILEQCMRLYPSSIRKEVEQYLMLMILFFEGDDRAFLKEVQSLGLTSLYTAAQATIRFLEILVYMRLRDEDTLEQKVDAYRHWLREEKSVKAGQIDAIKNRLRVLRKMWTLYKKHQVKQAREALEHANLPFTDKATLAAVFQAGQA